jgi:hypothetical protein
MEWELRRARAEVAAARAEPQLAREEFVAAREESERVMANLQKALDGFCRTFDDPGPPAESLVCSHARGVSNRRVPRNLLRPSG